MVGANMGRLLPAYGTRLAFGVAVLCLVGCEVTIASDVDEAQANRTLVGLQNAGVVAEKSSLPGDTQRFRISVARGDAPVALRHIVEQRLLDREPAGLRGPHADDVLVKSREMERAELASRLAEELEGTLQRLDGVELARVHLTLPADNTQKAADSSARASVLLRSHEASPLNEAQVKTLLQGAVANLPADRIDVVVVQGSAPTSSPGPSLTRIGPITLTTQSAGSFRAFALGLIGLNLALLTICSAMWWRWRKNTHEGS
jgi:type III secretion protein J